MGECADANEIDARSTDRIYRREGDTAARFKIYAATAPQANGLAHFFNAQIIEHDDVDAVHGEKVADLLQRLGFEFHSMLWVSLAKGADVGSELRQARAGDVVFLYHRHIVESEPVVGSAAG